MNYTLTKPKGSAEAKSSAIAAMKRFWPFLQPEKKSLLLALFAMVTNAGLTLLAPWVVGYAIDTFVQAKQYQGVLASCAFLLALYFAVLVLQYYQTTWMGGVGQRVLFRLRNALFNKLQELPVAFFNQNKAGDLISRLNNDTDKLQQFFTQSLMQFIGSVFIMIGAGVFLVLLQVPLGMAALLPALALFLFTQVISGWVKRMNAANLRSVGGMSAEIQESLGNFKVIVAFNRRDYFRRRFQEVNEEAYATSVTAGLANNLFVPVFGLSAHAAQLVV